MEAKVIQFRPIVNACGTMLAVTLTGFGIGWLIGLSVSPVVSIVIASVTGSSAAVVAALSGLERREGWRVNPWPVGLLLLGLVLGSTAGMRARNEDMFGQDVKATISRWKAAGLSMNDADVALRLFEINYPMATAGTTAGVANLATHTSSVLFADETEACSSLTVREGESLRNELRNSPVTEWRPLADLIEDPAVLKQIVERVLCADKSSS